MERQFTVGTGALMDMDTLHLKNLTLAYGDEPIIDRLDLAIPAGRITALVGPNGCGKSTLLRGMARLLEPRTGAVTLDGKAIHSLPTRQVARRLGILPQGPSAPEGLTVLELVQQGRFPHLGFFQQRGDEDERIVREALRITRMVELADRPLDTLSGGQRQRAWIAMALAQDTSIMLLDEPTTFLDLAHQVEVLDLLVELNERGRTIVMVLHELNQACRYADYLVAMRKGRIYAQGAPEEVMSTEMIYEVFGLQCQLMACPVAGTPMCVPLGRAQRAQTPSMSARLGQGELALSATRPGVSEPVA